MVTLSETAVYIDDTPGISVMEIRTKCRKLKMEKNIGLVVIDYLQLVQGSNKRGGSREQEISEISRSLKILAKELNMARMTFSRNLHSLINSGFIQPRGNLINRYTLTELGIKVVKTINRL